MNRYLAVKKQLKEEINNLNPDDTIRSERVLANEFNVSRMTLRKAISELVDEGYLYRKKK